MYVRTRVRNSVVAMATMVIALAMALPTQAQQNKATSQASDPGNGTAPETQPQATVTTSPQVTSPKPETQPERTPSAEPATADLPPASGTRPNTEHAHMIPLTSGLGTGLMHTVLTDLNHRVAMGLHLEWFRQSDFLIAGHDETNTRLAGGLHMAFRVYPSIELQLALLSSSNRNERTREADTYEPEVQRSMGDFMLGGKWAMPIDAAPGLDIGFEGFVRLYSGVGDIAPDIGATSIAAMLLASYSLKQSAGIPVGLHLNAGYIQDNSYSLLDSPDWANAESDVLPELFYTYIVHRYAMGVMPSRALLRLAADYTHRFMVAGSPVYLTPFMEYSLIYFVDDDSNLSNIEQYLSVDTEAAKNGNTSQVLTLGLNAMVTPEVSIGLGADINISQPGYKVAPSLPPYNVLASITFVPSSQTSSSAQCPACNCPVCKPKEIIKVVKEPAKAAAPVTGAIVGLIKDDKGNPVPGAAVSLPGVGMSDVLADESGSFSTCSLKAGSYKVIAYKKGFEQATTEVRVEPGKKASVSLVLKHKAAQGCDVAFEIRDAKKNRKIKASITIRGKDSAGKDISMEETIPASGKNVTVPTGTYRVVIKSRKYLTVSKELDIKSCPAPKVTVSLKRKPRKSHIKLNRRKTRILLRRKIYFKRNTARLTERSKLLLDEIAAFLIEHPEIKLVRIDGHTDNKGSDEYNRRLSQKRADAVRAYLISKGVESSRLRTKGYGRSRPIYPNISERARAKNRRVEFHILKLAK